MRSESWTSRLANSGDDRVHWRPSPLLVVVSIIAWMLLTIWIAREEIGTRSETRQILAWDPNGLDYQVELRVEGKGFDARDGFRVLKYDCQMSCQVVELAEHRVNPTVEFITEFLGNRQVVAEGPQGRRTLRLEWGYRNPVSNQDRWNFWDEAGRFIGFEDAIGEWMREIEPGVHLYPGKIWIAIRRSWFPALIPVLLAWLLIGFMSAVVTNSRMQRRGTRCPLCGYDLRGLTSKGCPECGWDRD